MQAKSTVFQARKASISTIGHRNYARFQLQTSQTRPASTQRIHAEASNVVNSQKGALCTQLLAEIQNVPERDRSGPPIAAVEDILDQLKQLAEQCGYSKAEPLSSVRGKFRQVVATTDFVDESRSVPLGALTFHQIGPKDLKVYMVPSTNLGGLFQGHDTSDQYCIATPFKVGEGEHEGLVGINSVIGTFSVEEGKPHRQEIGFQSLKIEPADTSADKLTAWLSLFKESNPTMNEDGVVVIEFPQPIKGWRDFVYLNENTQVSIGNRGGMYVVERAE